MVGFLNLRGSVDGLGPVEPRDAIRTKTALNRLGLYEPPSSGINRFVDDRLLDGMRTFQR